MIELGRKTVQFSEALASLEGAIASHYGGAEEVPKSIDRMVWKAIERVGERVEPGVWKVPGTEVGMGRKGLSPTKPLPRGRPRRKEVCNECGYTFYGQRNLVEHYLRKHPKLVLPLLVDLFSSAGYDSGRMGGMKKRMKVKRWGEDLVLVIPKGLARATDLKPGMVVEMDWPGGTFRVAKPRKTKPVRALAIEILQSHGGEMRYRELRTAIEEKTGPLTWTPTYFLHEPGFSRPKRGVVRYKPPEG